MEEIGTNNFLLVSAAFMSVCIFVVVAIIRREDPQQETSPAPASQKKKGVGGRQAIVLLRNSKHLQIIALVISFAAIGAAIIEQQLNMAAEADRGQDATDAITAFLGQVQLYTSSIGFIVQIWLTSRIHRFLGIGFALMVLPVSLGTTALVMLLNRALWAPALARVLDQSLRYTVDKTTREILFLPLPSDVKYQAKAFVDVTIDRFAKGLGAVLILVLIKPWGLELGWQQLSYASLAMTGIWVVMAIRARRGYLLSFRQSIERQDMKPTEMRLSGADLSTIETLIEELASPDEQRVLYAIDMLESLDKRNLITPLLLYHESPKVKARALTALSAAPPETAERWLPNIQRTLGDESTEVRTAAVSALANIRQEQAAELVRPYLEDDEVRIATTAAVVVARSGRDADLDAAEATLTRFLADSVDGSSEARRCVAAAIGEAAHPRFRHLLIPLLYDGDPEVAAEAMRSVQQAGTADFLFVPTLVALLRHRRLKRSARGVLVSYGEDVLDALAFFLDAPEEDIWVRRHIPATIARIPCQKSMDILVGSLGDPDGFLRFKVVSAIGRLRRTRPDLTIDHAPIEALALKEGLRYFNYLSLHYNLAHRAKLSRDTLLVAALEEKIARTTDRIYRLLGLIFPWKDIAAARWAVEHGDARARAGGLEYLDNILKGPLRKRIIPVLEDTPLDEKARRGNILLKTRPRDVEETLLQLINDDDQVVSAAAIDLVRERQLWSLADDIEHVLAHRSVSDWYVFEAASWTLAAHRLPDDRRRALWLEPLPAVELASRLRQLPLFAGLWVDELFRLAGVGRQIRHEGGHVVFREGTVPESAQFLLDGRVTIGGHVIAAYEVGPPASLGFEEMLEGSPTPATARTVDRAVCLTFTADEIQTLLADNTDLVQGLFRMLIARSRAHEMLVLRGHAESEITRLAVDGLSPIEKVLALQKLPVFSAISAEET